MHKLLLVLAFAGTFLSVRAQETPVRTTDVFKATILNPGVSYEKSIGQKHTLYSQVYMNPTLQYLYSSSMGSETDFYFDPAASLQYRFYYNLRKRADREKFTRLNSGNYVGIAAESFLSKMRLSDSYLKETKRRPVTTVAAIWGMQRNYAGRFSLDITLGAGYRFASSLNEDINWTYTRSMEGQFAILAQVGLGIWLNKRS